MTVSDSTRLLLELEKLRRDINREVLNRAVPELHIEDIHPIESIAAESRSVYLQALFDIARRAPELPSREEIDNLAWHRRCYEELRAAVDVLEEVIDRGYLDVAHD